MKKTLVIGVSQNPSRYANQAVSMLKKHGHHTLALGKTSFAFEGTDVLSGMPDFTDVHTITLYLNPFAQQAYYEYILALKPKRIIFNPGTENDELEELASKQGIEVLEACTLVLLSTAQY
jgi:predicted CoA-binding protein